MVCVQDTSVNLIFVELCYLSLILNLNEFHAYIVSEVSAAAENAYHVIIV